MCNEFECEHDHCGICSYSDMDCEGDSCMCWSDCSECVYSSGCFVEN